MTDVHYNEQALLDQLMLCTEYVDKAERYELLGPLYRLVIPIYERRKNYEALLACYQHLTKAYAKVIEVTQSGKRLLGRFYRVAFYGKSYFGDDEEGIEFIYKEPKITSLSEISEKLQTYYEMKYSAENVKMIMDSAPHQHRTTPAIYSHSTTASVQDHSSYLQSHTTASAQDYFSVSTGPLQPSTVTPLQHQHRTTPASAQDHSGSAQDHCSISTGPLQPSTGTHYSIGTGPVQHQDRTTSASGQDHFSIRTGPLQHQHRTTPANYRHTLQHQHKTTSASAQDHTSNSTGPLQHQHRTTPAIYWHTLQHQHRTTPASAQDHCSISTGPLQHQDRTTSASGQDHCSISTGPLQPTTGTHFSISIRPLLRQHRTTPATAQDHCSISTGPPQPSTGTHYSISTGPLQHQDRTTSASGQDHFSIRTGPLQHQHRTTPANYRHTLQHQHKTTSASAQDHTSNSTGPLQHQHRTTPAIYWHTLQHQHRTTQHQHRTTPAIYRHTLQHQHRTTSASAQDHFSNSTGHTTASAQDQFSISTGPLQPSTGTHYSINTGPVQHQHRTTSASAQDHSMGWNRISDPSSSSTKKNVSHAPRHAKKANKLRSPQTLFLPVKRDELDPKVAYIQVTYVRAATEGGGVSAGAFESAHNVKRFVYETPFTRDGAARGPVHHQWRRLTHLTAENYFPYVKRRIPVSETSEEEKSPIEVALSEMESQVAELSDIVRANTCDIKRLQLRLQGSICVQVNAGPLAYANAFLDPALAQMYPDEHVDKLKAVFKEFLTVCHAALQQNAKLISSDQVSYHEALEDNYYKLSNSLSEILGEPLQDILVNGNLSTTVTGVEVESSNA
ncbi:unnamed protein product [Plutella xylostella]|uniref:(diamondback moth) hypothetical protein n=1 Tax=Plutella xylostella TaxID=51655 RepID=A0A8S4DJG0_PLUXY|nr:unnamed protein product [Plutella xylostella]